MDAPFPAGLMDDIERVLREDDSPPALDLYPAVFESLMFPLQRQDELAAMIRLARMITPRVVMEIGADKGGGCYHFLKGLRPDRFIGVEIRGTPYGEALSRAFEPTRCLWLEASSYDPKTVEIARGWLAGQPIDVLFIDGDKARFLDDFEAYLPHVRQGGLVFMHDVRDPTPGRAFILAATHPRVRAAHALESTIETAFAIAREVEGHPPASSHEGWLRHWRGASCGLGVLWV